MKRLWRRRALSLILLLALLVPNTRYPTLAALSETRDVPSLARAAERDHRTRAHTALQTMDPEWTWTNPLPQGNTLRAVWGSGPEDVFAVGDHGTIVHYDGYEWRLMESGTTQQLNGVWGSSDADVFVVGGGGTILHYNGAAWSAVRSGISLDLNGVWGSSASSVFAVGVDGIIQYFDGSAWTRMSGGTTSTLNAVWGSSADSVLAVGENGVILRYDGNVWKGMDSVTDGTLTSIWGTGTNDVFATAFFDILHFDGSTWSIVDCSANSGWVCIGSYSVWGTGPGNVYIVGNDGRGMYGAALHYDGSVLSGVDTGTTAELYGVWSSSSGEVFAVGDYGTILHYDGLAWQTVSSRIAPVGSESLGGIWGNHPENIYAVGGGYIYASSSILHYDGIEWTWTTNPAAHALSGIWGSGDHVFSVGSGLTDYGAHVSTILHTTGDGWTAMESGTLEMVWLADVWGHSSSDVFAVGSGGTILHYDGRVWQPMNSGTTVDLYGVWGGSETEIYAVGANGTILRYDGTTWHPMESGTTDNLSGIWGSGPNDIFVVGGIILHYDGGNWRKISDFSASAVWGSAPNNVFAAGGATILHYDGAAWRAMSSGTDNGLTGIWGSGPNDVYVVGQGGAILHYGGPVGVADNRATDVSSPVHWIARVSVASDGTQANGRSSDPSISRDGRYTAFSSLASNLVADDTNERNDVFVHDLVTRETTRVSVSSERAQAEGGSSEPHISADGRYVAFVSHASNLVPDDNNGVADIFVHDLATGETTRVSVSSTGDEGNGKSYTPYISGDGRYVTFVSTANNLVPNDTNSCEPAFSHADGHCPDVFVHDRETGRTELVSVNSDGRQVNGESGYRSRPSISDDGRFVAFNRWDVDSPFAFVLDRVWIRDREDRTTTTVSVVEYGGWQHSWQPSISADGLRIAYQSMTQSAISGEASRCRAQTGIHCTHIYVHNRGSGETIRASVDSQGRQGLDGNSDTPRISADGNLVVFSSTASNLVPDDTNNHCGFAGQQANKSCSDIFVHDLSTRETRRVSVRPDGDEANHSSRAPGISAHGEYVVFESTADNLVDDDTNGEADLFVVSLVPSNAPPAPAAVPVAPVAELVETDAIETEVPPATVEIPQVEEVGELNEADPVEPLGRAALPIAIALIIAGLLILGVVAVFLFTRYRAA
jgi:Tol biopolymer transport system component